MKEQILTVYDLKNYTCDKNSTRMRVASFAEP